MTAKRECPRDVLQRLAEAMVRYTSNGQRFYSVTGTIGAADHDEVVRALSAYRSAVAPLRSRAEVDAEIVAAARSLGRQYTVAAHELISKLSSEPTSDED